MPSCTNRFDVPVSVDTWRASVAAASFAAGACVGNDISGFADPEYLTVASRANATVVATHIRLRPRVADPDPHYDDVTDTVRDFLLERRQWAYDAGLGPEQVILDAGLDLGKTAAQSLQLLRDSDQLAALGSPLLLSASNKTFLGKALSLEVGERASASLAATAIGIILGCRIVRVHDVAGTVRVRDTIERLLRSAVSSASVCVVGTDATMVYDAVHNAVAKALGDLDPSFALQDFTAKDVTLTAGESTLPRIMEALNTPPFLVERRVVVVRDAQLLVADEVAELLQWMAHPAPGTTLIVAVVGAKSNKLVKAADEVLEVNVGSRTADRVAFVKSKMDEYGVDDRPRHGAEGGRAGGR